MSYELLQVEICKRERRERVEEAFIPPHTEKEPLQLYDPKYPGKARKLREVRRLWEKPGNSGLPRSTPKRLTP
jgi:hypothetical protein